MSSPPFTGRPTPTKDLRALVGKRVRIERDGVTYKGELLAEHPKRCEFSSAGRRG